MKEMKEMKKIIALTEQILEVVVKSNADREYCAAALATAASIWHARNGVFTPLGEA